MTLYEINTSITNAIEHGCDTETGEIISADELDALQIAREEKIENIGLLIKNLNAEAAALKAEKDAFAARQKSAENRVEWLKRYLANNLNGETFKTSRIAMSWRKSDAVEIQSMESVPEAYMKYKDPEPDKMAIKKALKAGECVPGCVLVEKNNLQIK